MRAFFFVASPTIPSLPSSLSISAKTRPSPPKPLPTLFRPASQDQRSRSDLDPGSPPPIRYFCPCGRRHLIGASGAALLPIRSSKAGNGLPSDPDPTAVVEKFHPSRPDWYEELYARALEQGMRAYEDEVAGIKAELFNRLEGKNKKVLEIGVGTGSNFKYYANASGLDVVGVDPMKKMEKYARAAASAAGLPPANFTFIRGVGEALPLTNNSVDAVIGTLVLCSVKDVDMALSEVRRVLKPGGLYLFIEHVAAKDGSLLRFVQSILDPLQQFVSDGCHLTRETGKQINDAGFSSVSLDAKLLSILPFISPHVYGIACK